MLKVRNISFNYPGQSHFSGLKNFSLDLDRSEVLAIVGKSGSGKTTALKCIFGLEDLHSGTVSLDNEPVLGPAYNLIPGHPDMRLVSQDFYVLDNHTVQENIFDKLAGYKNEEKIKRAQKLMRLLELVPLKDSRARTLSSGQKQRVAIARALAIIPKVLLLDEAFNNLDKMLADKLFTFIVAEVKNKKSALILITHVAEEALKYADKVIVMDKGRILQQGNTWEVYYNPRNSRLAGLLGAYNILKREDLAHTSELGKKRASMFVRPDLMKPCVDESQTDLTMIVRSCRFNGKCFELTGETESGNSVLVYHDSPVAEGLSFCVTLKKV
jgi:iron(III) transport system ATP-binding protein